MIVVDTNVLSELMRPLPSAAVKEWMLALNHSEIYTTSITRAEIQYGIERLPQGRRKEILRVATDDVFGAFEDHVLPFDARAAVYYALIVSERDGMGLPIDGFDAQIASICRSHNASLATRNLRDFEHTGVDVIDPWHQK